LVHRGPAYTQLALYAKINKEGHLELVNELDIELGSNPEEILKNIDSNNFSQQNIKSSNKLGSDDKYSHIVRDVESNTPARFNSDKRLLYGVSGSAGKVAVFAVRVNTYPKPNKSKVFYIGTNNPDNFTQIRKDILVNFKNLPRLGDYMHKDCYEAAKKYSKDSFIVIEKLGTKFLPTLFEIKRKVDLLSKYFKFLPNRFSDHLMQLLSKFYPNHLPKRMENFKDKYDHLWIIEMVDNGIEEAKGYFEKYFKSNEGDFFICTENESKKAMLHRYVSAGAFGRYQSLKNKTNNESFSMDIALPRNEINWFENLPDEIESSIELKLYYGHLFCHVMHQNYIVKNGVNPKEILNKLLDFYNQRGAEYPAEHNVGHEYKANKTLVDFYKKLDPTNSFNPGIGNTSKSKYWN
jgi:D-lactate dehydrogenase